MYFSPPTQPTSSEQATPTLSSPPHTLFQNTPPSTPSLPSPFHTPGVELLNWKKNIARSPGSDSSFPPTPTLESPVTPYVYETKSLDESTPALSPSLAKYSRLQQGAKISNDTFFPSTPTLESPVAPYVYETTSFDETTPPLSPSLALYSKLDTCATPPTPMFPSPPITTSFLIPGGTESREAPITPQSCSPQSYKFALPSPCKYPGELYYK